MNYNVKSAKGAFRSLSILMILCFMIISLVACGTPSASSSSESVAPLGNSCKIIFDSRGGASIDPAEVGADGTITMPADPTWEKDYAFGGWYADQDYTTPFNNSDLNADATVYAKWTKDGKTVRTQMLDLSQTAQDQSNSDEGWAWDEASRTLTLTGFVLDTTSALQEGPQDGIVFPSCPNVPNAETTHQHTSDCPITTLILTDGTHNVVDISAAATNDYSSSIYCGSPLTVKTSGGGVPGTLQATAGEAPSTSIAIFVDGDTVIESGNITATSGASKTHNSIGIGVYGAGTLSIEGGTVIATAGTTMAAPWGENPSGSFGIVCNKIQLNGGSVTAVGGTAKDTLSAGILGTWLVSCNGGQITAQGDTAAVTSFMELTAAEAMTADAAATIAQVKETDPNGNILHTLVDNEATILKEVTLGK